MKKVLTSAFAAAFILSGCCWLPAGDPPEGNILHNETDRGRKVKNAAEAADYLISALTIILLEKCPGEKISIKADDISHDIACRILHETGRITGNTMTYGESEWVLQSFFGKGELQLQLYRKDKMIWSEKLLCLFPVAKEQI